MKPSFINDLEDRKRQVRHYLLIVARQERSLKKHSTLDPVSEGRLLTLRAGTFLILYNLIEATVRGAIQSIHDHIATKRTPFPDLNIELRKEVIVRFKKIPATSSTNKMNDFPSEFVAVALSLSDAGEISGNVDARKIRDFAERYGFSSNTEKLVTRDGIDLVAIKRNRNDLAHGIKTFEEVGRDHTSQELLAMGRRTMAYMTQISNNVVTYLENEDYKDEACKTMLAPIASANEGGTALPINFPIFRKFTRVLGLLNSKSAGKD